MSNFKKRFLTSTVIGVIFLVLFLFRAFLSGFGIYLFDAFFLVLICFATLEVSNVKKINTRGAKEYIAFIVFGLLYLFYIIGAELLNDPFPWWLHIIISVLIIGIFTLFIAFSNMTDKNLEKKCKLEKRDLNKESWLGALDFLKMLFYPGMFIACLILINHMTVNNVGLFGLMLVFFISCFTDVGAYCVGITLGKNTKKMAPKLSPKKTWVGFVGGIFGGILGCLIALWIMTTDADLSTYLVSKIQDAIWVQILFAFIGLLGSLITAGGDLYASLVKRKAGVKDYGAFLPGHGGFMDRLDGIIFNAPFILLIMGII